MSVRDCPSALESVTAEDGEFDGDAVIFDDVKRLMNAQTNHHELADLLGVHLTTLHRWAQQTATPNATHAARIQQLLGAFDQGQLFHTAPGLPQSEATARYGTAPIPGLLLFSASKAADPFRLQRYAEIIAPSKLEAKPPPILIESTDVRPRTYSVFGRPYDGEPVTEGTLTRAGDVLLSHGAQGHWCLGVVHPSSVAALCRPTVLVLRPKNMNGHILARLIPHPVVLHQVMPFSTPGEFSDLFIDRLLQAVLPMNKEQGSHLNDWGTRLTAAIDECHILNNAIGRETEKVAADWREDLSLESADDS